MTMLKNANTDAFLNNLDEKINYVLEIIRLMGETKLAELDFEIPNLKITLKKYANLPAMKAQPTLDVPSIEKSTFPQNFVAIQKRSSEVKAPKEDKTVEKNSNTKVYKIVSPMAGTFYQAPSPSSPPYVKENDFVNVGQTVCIVEAMKQMNEIKADKAGKIVKILVQNAQPVDKGTELFLLELA